MDERSLIFDGIRLLYLLLIHVPLRPSVNAPSAWYASLSPNPSLPSDAYMRKSRMLRQNSVAPRKTMTIHARLHALFVLQWFIIAIFIYMVL